MKTIIALFAVVLSLVTLPSCAALSQGCQKALPVLNLGQVYGQDAVNALEQVQAMVDHSSLPADKKKIIQDSIDKARLALRAAIATMQATSEQCSAPNLLEAFQSFNEIWSIIKGLIGTNIGPGLVGVAPGSSAGIVDPMVYRKAGGQ